MASASLAVPMEPDASPEPTPCPSPQPDSGGESINWAQLSVTAPRVALVAGDTIALEAKSNRGPVIFTLVDGSDGIADLSCEGVLAAQHPGPVWIQAQNSAVTAKALLAIVDPKLGARRLPDLSAPLGGFLSYKGFGNGYGPAIRLIRTDAAWRGWYQEAFDEGNSEDSPSSPPVPIEIASESLIAVQFRVPKYATGHGAFVSTFSDGILKVILPSYKNHSPSIPSLRAYQLLAVQRLEGQVEVELIYQEATGW